MSPDVAAVVTCDLLSHEVRRALVNLGREGTRVAPFPASCHLGGDASARQLALLGASTRTHGPSIGVCLNCARQSGEGGEAHPGIDVVAVEAQAELVMGAEAARHALDQGDFLVLPAWLASWQAIVQTAWGFDQPTAAAFFAESSRRLLVLDTGAVPVDPAQVEAMARFVDRPAEVRFVGTSHLEALLDRAFIAAERREEVDLLRGALARIRERSAEQATVTEYFTTLGQLLEEHDVTAQLEATVTLLFDARRATVRSVVPPTAGEGAGERIEVPDGLVQPIHYRGEVLAELVVEGVARPEAVPRYRPLARALCAASGIAVHAARLYRREQATAQALALRVEELDAFALIAAHDLRGPLTGIFGFADVLREVHGHALTGSGRELLEGLTRSARAMSALVDDLLKLSRIGHQTGEVTRVRLDTHALVSSLASDIVARTPGRAGRVVVCGRLPALFTSPAWAREVLENLISNGLRYNDSEVPSVEIAAWAGIAQRASTGGLPLVGLTVTDNGRGIPAEEQAHAFTMFRRLSSSRDREGTGIGLAIVRRIVEAEGGSVRLESKVGVGTTFFVEMPGAE